MKKIAFLAVTLFASVFTLSAQKEQTLFGSSGLRLSGGWGASTTSLTFFKDDFAITTGGFGGLEFGKTVFLGWGGFRTTNDFRIDKLTTDRVSMNYNGLMVGYAPKAHKAIHPQFMILGGGGRMSVRGEGTDEIFVIQPSAGVELNVLRWFRIGLEGGYRFVGDTDFNGIVDSDVSAPFGQLTFKFGYSWGRSNRNTSDDFDNN
jgi:hypothetical protein